MGRLRPRGSALSREKSELKECRSNLDTRALENLKTWLREIHGLKYKEAYEKFLIRVVEKMLFNEVELYHPMGWFYNEERKRKLQELGVLLSLGEDKLPQIAHELDRSTNRAEILYKMSEDPENARVLGPILLLPIIAYISLYHGIALLEDDARQRFLRIANIDENSEIANLLRTQSPESIVHRFFPEDSFDPFYVPMFLWDFLYNILHSLTHITSGANSLKKVVDLSSITEFSHRNIMLIRDARSLEALGAMESLNSLAQGTVLAVNLVPLRDVNGILEVLREKGVLFDMYEPVTGVFPQGIRASLPLANFIPLRVILFEDDPNKPSNIFDIRVPTADKS